MSSPSYPSLYDMPLLFCIFVPNSCFYQIINALLMIIFTEFISFVLDEHNHGVGHLEWLEGGVSTRKPCHWSECKPDQLWSYDWGGKFQRRSTQPWNQANGQSTQRCDGLHVIRQAIHRDFSASNSAEACQEEHKLFPQCLKWLS